MKRGSLMDSALQSGHFPGLLSFSRFEKTNPHFLHSAGMMIRCLPDDTIVLLICSRCPQTSLSGIPTAADTSLAEQGPSSSSAMISCLTVSCIAWGTLGFFVCSLILSSVEHYIAPHTEWQNTDLFYIEERNLFRSNQGTKVDYFTAAETFCSLMRCSATSVFCPYPDTMYTNIL